MDESMCYRLILLKHLASRTLAHIMILAMEHGQRLRRSLLGVITTVAVMTTVTWIAPPIETAAVEPISANTPDNTKTPKDTPDNETNSEKPPDNDKSKENIPEDSKKPEDALEDSASPEDTPDHSVNPDNATNEEILEIDRRLASEFGAVISLPSAPESTCLVLYRDNELVIDVKGRLSLVPASLMKIATAAAAFEVMGPDAVYTTEVFTDSDALTSVSNGTLRGDLYLVGGGDPVLAAPEYIERWSEPKAYTDVTVLADRVFASLREYGISRIEGRVLGDESWYPDAERDYTGVIPEDGQSPLWKRSWLDVNLVGPLSGLLLNDGYSTYSQSTNSAGRRANKRAADPAQHAASDFDDLLEERGMVITSRPRSGIAPDKPERVSLGSLKSPPMSEIVGRMLARSDNTTAEMILKEIGRRTLGSSREKAVQGAQAALRRVLGPLAADISMSDGSGLSYYNRMTCRAVAQLLLRAGPNSPMVLGMSIAGSWGTLRNCRPEPPLTGAGDVNRVFAKTGTLDHSTALAGTAVAANGGMVMFSMIANESYIIRIGFCNVLQRALLNAAAQYTYGVAPVVASFTDIAGSMHEAGIKAITTAGISRGCSKDGTLFCPDTMVTWAQMASFLARALGLNGPARALGVNNDDANEGGDDVEDVSQHFSDIVGNAHESAIAAVAAAGIMPGCSDDGTFFCPNALVTRAQMASFLARALGLNDPARALSENLEDASEGIEDVSQHFSDIVGNAHESAIAAVAAAGITLGCSDDGTLFCPDATVTRGQMASFLTRALKL